MMYTTVKVLHVLALTVWIVGLLLLSSSTSFSAAAPTFLRRLMRWNQRLIVPAMVLTWCCGLLMSFIAGWFGQIWLVLKMSFVAGLSVLQFWQTWVLARLSATPDYRVPAWSSLSGAMVFLLATSALMLVVAKPFF